MEKNIYFLSDMQNAFLMGRMRSDELFGVSCHLYLEIDGSGSDAAKRAEAAWKAVISSHRIFFYRILPFGLAEEIDENPTLENRKVIDLSACSEEERQTALSEIRKKTEGRLLRIEKGEIAGMSVCILPDNGYRLILDFDCLVCDINSSLIIVEEFLKFFHGEKAVINEKGFRPFPDCRNLLKEYQQISEEMKAYWKKRIGSSPVLPSFKRGTSSGEKKRSYIPHLYHLTQEETEKIFSYSAVKGTSTDVILLMLYIQSVHKMTGQDEFLINIPYLCREDFPEQYRNVAGDFNRLIIFSVKTENWDDPNLLIRDIHELYESDLNHKAYPGVLVQKSLPQKMVPITFSLHTENELLTRDSVTENDRLNYLVTQTPGVTLDAEFYMVNGRILLDFVGVSGWFEDHTEDELIRIFRKGIEDMDRQKGDGKMKLLDIQYEIHQIFQKTSGISEEFEDDRSFQSLGGTSLESCLLQNEIKKRFHFNISLRELNQYRTVQDLASYIWKKKNGEA